MIITTIRFSRWPICSSRNNKNLIDFPANNFLVGLFWPNCSSALIRIKNMMRIQWRWPALRNMCGYHFTIASICQVKVWSETNCSPAPIVGRRRKKMFLFFKQKKMFERTFLLQEHVKWIGSRLADLIAADLNCRRWITPIPTPIDLSVNRTAKLLSLKKNNWYHHDVLSIWWINRSNNSMDNNGADMTLHRREIACSFAGRSRYSVIELWEDGFGLFGVMHQFIFTWIHAVPMRIMGQLTINRARDFMSLSDDNVVEEIEYQVSGDIFHHSLQSACDPLPFLNLFFGDSLEILWTCEMCILRSPLCDVGFFEILRNSWTLSVCHISCDKYRVLWGYGKNLNASSMLTLKVILHRWSAGFFRILSCRYRWSESYWTVARRLVTCQRRSIRWHGHLCRRFDQHI